ncbi:hypothetical protein [Wenzhouxiangella sp. EGI_FJ10305]|uniref:hypothetical protein n=1 Tax=Wenzhouxiangella sp. EGI_FJ10305 TaxID=3243768 RepID=UPI0035DD25DB
MEASSTNFMLAVYSVVAGLAGAESRKIFETQRRKAAKNAKKTRKSGLENMVSEPMLFSNSVFDYFGLSPLRSSLLSVFAF